MALKRSDEVCHANGIYNYNLLVLSNLTEPFHVTKCNETIERTITGLKMAADSDGTLTAVVICEGDFHDPDFPKKFNTLLGKLNTILEQPKRKKKLIKVNKVEPWNSVRVTLSITKEAALKLRQLASEGSTALRALGILSVQLEGDTVISLRLVGQEIVLRTDNCSDATSGFGELSNILSQSQHSQPSATVPPTITSTPIEPNVSTSSLSKTTSSIATLKNGSVEDS
ncbi:Nuclear receptor coactivator 6, partial [Pseudolycoriella hygida]